MKTKGFAGVVLALTLGAFSATAASVKREEYSAKKDCQAISTMNQGHQGSMGEKTSN